MRPPRTLLVWCPDWPVVAAEIIEDVPAHTPVVVLHANRVVACSEAARAEGIRRGLRKREAQSRCPTVTVVEHDPDRDARAFEQVVAAVEEVVAGVEVVRPGACALGARGPARYFGGEERAAERIVEHVAQTCAVECQVGIADGVFAAGLAARAGRIVPRGGTREFLAGVDVAALERPHLTDLLRRLGLHTLGAFAALPAADVLTRFGFDAALAHRLAAGHDSRSLAVRRPPPDLDVTADYDDPLERVDVAAFAARALAERLHERLAGYGFACTRLGIEAVTAHGEELHRVWRHDGLLTAAAISDRVRWQLDGWLSGTNRPSAGGSGGGWGGSGHGGVMFGGGRGEVVSGGGHGGVGFGRGHGFDGAGFDGAGFGRGSGGVGFGFGLGGVGFGRGGLGRPTAGIIRLRLIPDGVVRHAGLQPGLWGESGEERERAHRALSRVQGLLGPSAVVTAVLGGGRSPLDQARLVPWGDERAPARPGIGDPWTDGPVAVPPWPGQLPPPAPAAVLPDPVPATVYDASGEPVVVSARLQISAAPTRLRMDTGPPVEITGWTGPWPVDERWWSSDEARRRARFQIGLADGRAMLLSLAAGRWTVEALYD